jgi:hypothetical protein
MPDEEFLALYREFGEIARIDINSLHTRGIAFVSFFDKRAAANAVDRMQGFQTRGRTIVTGFAAQPFEGSTLLVRPLQIGLSKLPIEICGSVLSAFGEIETMRYAADGFVVDYFDLRAARNAAANSGRIVIQGVAWAVEVLGQPQVACGNALQMGQGYGMYQGPPVKGEGYVAGGNALQIGQGYGMYQGPPVKSEGYPLAYQPGTPVLSDSVRAAILTLQEKLRPKPVS